MIFEKKKKKKEKRKKKKPKIPATVCAIKVEALVYPVLFYE